MLFVWLSAGLLTVGESPAASATTPPLAPLSAAKLDSSAFLPETEDFAESAPI